MYYRTLKIFHETKLRDFQYKIDNKILVTNSFLFKTNKIDNLAGSYCNNEQQKKKKKKKKQKNKKKKKNKQKKKQTKKTKNKNKIITYFLDAQK